MSAILSACRRLWRALLDAGAASAERDCRHEDTHDMDDVNRDIANE